MGWVKRFFILFAILLVLFIVALLFAEPVDFFPNEGIWYCEELQLQLSFEASEECFILVDGVKIECCCGSDRGSSWLYVDSQDQNTTLFKLGQPVFGGEYVSLDETKLVIHDPETNRDYGFLRLDSPPHS